MFTNTSKKSDKRKTLENEVLEIIEKLTKELLEVLDAEPKLRQHADELSSTIIENYDENSDLAKNIKFAVRVLMVVDVINSVGTKFEDTSDVKTALVMTAETVFGLSTMEAVALADGIGEIVFKSYQELPQDGKKNGAVDKTLYMLAACFDTLEKHPKED